MGDGEGEGEGDGEAERSCTGEGGGRGGLGCCVLEVEVLAVEGVCGKGVALLVRDRLGSMGSAGSDEAEGVSMPTCRIGRTREQG